MSYFGSYFGGGESVSSGGVGGVGGIFAPSPPVASPIESTHPEYVAHTADAVARLPQMFRAAAADE